MIKVTFYGACALAGCDMDSITVEVELDNVNLDTMGQDFVTDFYGIESWHEVHEE